MKLSLFTRNPVLASALCRGLQEYGHECRWIWFLGSMAPEADCLIVDEDTLTSSESERKIWEKAQIATVILTSRQRTHDRAATWLLKPFQIAELLMAVEGYDERPADSAVASSVNAALFARCDDRHSAVGNDQLSVLLTRDEYRALELLFRRCSRPVSARTICQEVWEQDWDGSRPLVAHLMERLQAKLRELGDWTIFTAGHHTFELRATSRRSCSQDSPNFVEPCRSLASSVLHSWTGE